MKDVNNFLNDLNKTSRSGMKKVLKIALMVILDTVSYTHLDVYKRQPIFPAADRG